MLIDHTELRLEFYQIFLALLAVRRVSPMLVIICAELLVHQLMPESLVLVLSEHVDLLVAALHPVGDIKHVPLYDKLDVLLALVEGRRPLQLFRLRVIQVIELLAFIGVSQS